LASASLDLLVKARTGTGKTIGFLVPAIEARIRQLETISSTPSSLSSSDLGRAPHQRLSPETRFATDTVGTLILSPTRELASQIAIESQKLTSHLPGYTTHLFVGGMDKQKQIRDFRPRRKDVVVSTPGRLRDLIQDDRSGVAQALKGCKMVSSI
jgi:ATP-dependent RNA helicase MSS116